MTGGVAVRRNLLCVTWSSARGHVFLFDLLAREPTSSWALPAPSTGYSDAAGVAMDDRFHLFVADPHNHCVRHFSAFGRHLGDLGGPPEPGGGAARDKPGVLWRPQAVALAGDELLVAGGDQPQRRAVRRFDRQGGAAGHLRSLGDPEAEWGAPRGLWSDRTGVLVADTLHGRVQRFLPDGRFVAAFACGGAGRSRPVAVARARDQRILVVDAGDEATVRAFAADGSAAPPGEVPARAEQASALALDDRGRVYLLDHAGERVQRFHADLSFDAVVVDLAEHLDGFPSPAP